MEKGSHIVSLSLGTAAEPTGLVVVDPRTEVLKPDEECDLEEVYSRQRAGYGRQLDSENYFNVTWIKRFPAGYPIPEVVARVSELISNKLLAKKCSLLLDISSTGAAPCRVFENRGLYPELVNLTNAGAEEHAGPGVPLRDVISAALVVVQTRRLKVAHTLEQAATLADDLLAFDPKPVMRGVDLRGGRNADLVFALAAALWWADDLTWGDDGAERERPRHGHRSAWSV